MGFEQERTRSGDLFLKKTLLASRSPDLLFLQLRRSYFQFLNFPSAIHSIACLSRRARVSSAFASVIHSMYSRARSTLRLSSALNP
jgi:hypothetical protein